jgi:riboflavin kinase / FMN adenylyltransferase
MQTVWLEGLAPRGWPFVVVTIGNFDGVHRGHQALVASCVEGARARAGTAAVLTLHPHPARLLDPARAPAALTTLAQKEELLGALGVDRLVVLPFTTDLAHRSAEEFARGILADALGARRVIIGDGFRFGRGREGDAATLVRLGAGLGFEVVAVAPVELEGSGVSRSRVREALAEGEVARARALLGRAYFVDGRVVRGEGRGRLLGVPTANVETENEILPAAGVYAGRCRVASGRWHPAVVNLGRRPTFGGGARTLEAHLMDFEGDLYDSRVRLGFLDRLRDERRFAGPKALVAQIRDDIARARAVVAALDGKGV